MSLVTGPRPFPVNPVRNRRPAVHRYNGKAVLVPSHGLAYGAMTGEAAVAVVAAIIPAQAEAVAKNGAEKEADNNKLILYKKSSSGDGDFSFPAFEIRRISGTFIRDYRLIHHLNDSMKNSLLLLLGLSLMLFSSAQVKVDAGQLTGTWELKSVKFKGPVDLNSDGVKSADAYDEYNACQKDQQLELAADKSAKTYYGAHQNSCTPQTQAYTWQTKQQKIKDVRYDNGKRIVTEKEATLLRLKDPEDMDSPVFIVMRVSRKELVLKGELRDGSDSTSEAIIVYKRKK